MKVEIITLSPDQWQQYKAIRLEALTSDPQAFGRTYSEIAAREDAYWHDRLAMVKKGDLFLFFARTDRIVGMMGAKFDEHDASRAVIISTFVKSEFRGMGIASLLLAHLLSALCHDSRIISVRLNVSVDQKNAVALYKKYGFVISKYSQRKMGDEKIHDEYEMMLQL